MELSTRVASSGPAPRCTVADVTAVRPSLAASSTRPTSRSVLPPGCEAITTKTFSGLSTIEPPVGKDIILPTREPKVLVNEVSVTFESRGRSVVALDRISLQAHAGEFLCIVGPSGSGKSTLLRVLAGLHRQSAGEVRIQAERPGSPLTAMVFQEHALLPWRTVRDNVTFGLENRGIGRAECHARAGEMLAMVGLTRFAQHYPHQLSGGMKQRVGIARALASDPEVLLMDEPLAALDAQTRTIMQEELLRIWATLGKTVVYVTHSLEEALLLGDRVVLLTARPGRVSQIYPVDLGRPRGLEVRASPAYGALLETIWSRLREEVVRAIAADRGAGSDGVAT